MRLTKDAIAAVLHFDDTQESASLPLYVPALGCSVEATIDVPIGSTSISAKSLETLNDIVGLSAEDCSKIRELLYDDAMRAREFTAYGDPSPATSAPTKPASMWKRVFGARENTYRFVALAHDDPRHPCYFEDGIKSIDAKITWNNVLVSEHVVSSRRLALLCCTPTWEEEHGVCVVLRDGEPIGLTQDYVTGLYDYEDRTAD